MTVLSAPAQITKQYRLWRRYDEGSADYYCIHADGTELLSLRPRELLSLLPGKPPYRHIIGGFCQDCAMSQFYPNYPVSECTWPECPRRNGPSPRDHMAPVQSPLAVTEAMTECTPSPRVADNPAPARELIEPVEERDPEPVAAVLLGVDGTHEE